MDRTLALAGVVQAAYLVKQLAWKGYINQIELENAIKSIFETDPKRVIDVYGNTENLSLGLHGLISLFSDKSEGKDPEITRYAISLLHLERLLIKKPDMIAMIQKGIERAKNQANHFHISHDNVIANLASIYTDTLSTFNFRIHVSGETNCLSNPSVINKIRTILLAGVRSAVLWRQLEGSRWQLVFGKRALIEDARRILQQIRLQQPEKI